jgi:hypothetical protein
MRRSLLALFVGLALLLPAIPAAAARPAAPVPFCDPIDTQQCLLPFPDNFFTVPDASSATGVRLHFPVEAMPKNVSGTPINPTDWNRQDGFSPGSAIMVRVPNLDLARTGIAPITDIGRSLDPNAPVVLLDTNTGQRVPYWAEFDTWNPDATTRALVIRPARNYLEGHRIVVALRDLKNARGRVLRAPAGFERLRNHRHTADPLLRNRQADINQVLDDLARGGVRKHRLYLAWDFTVASAHTLAGDVLHMRDDAYAQLGSGVPSFTVTQIDQNPSADIARRVQGTFDVPKYLTGDGSAGSRLVLGADGLPVRNGVYHAQFRCLIPASTVDSAGKAKPGRGWVYGHGLLGSTTEIEGFAPFINQYDVVLCATPEIGMASDDVGNVVNVLHDLSTFGSIPDRLDQGMLNMQFLARLLKDPNGFGANTAFRVGTPAASAIVPNEVFYNGNSQGGIFGGAATAISKEWTRAVLGVPAMNYSELLPRSVDFDQFLPLLHAAYPDPTLSTLLVQLDQIQWDRGDPNGFAQHLTSNPYPGTPNHTVLMIEAFGDHQVANIGTETEARTIGAHVHQPAVAPGRSNDVVPFWDIPPVPSSPFAGSVVELWDFGTPAPPTLSLPPESPQYGSDPHGAARNVAAVRDQVSQFLQTSGAFVNVCGTQPCHP